MQEKKSGCFGCEACKAVCPNHAITMIPDDEGFLYPSINSELCAHCGKCDTVCPQNSKNMPISGYAFLHDEAKILVKSASGGAFGAISSVFWKKNPNGLIYGAAFDENLSVKHICVSEKDGLHTLHGSKYVQSEIGDVYCDILQKLEQNIPVLFSGTPCQAAALRRIAGYHHHLCIVDLVCNGVSSPKAWKNYLTQCENSHAKRIADFSFRNKQYYMGRGVSFTFEDGEKLQQSHSENLYSLLYMLNLINRPSCAECPFTTPGRDSDITLGDFHGLDNIDPDFSSVGASLVIPHTESGKEYISELMKIGKIHEYPIEKCIQPRLSGPAKPSPLRKLMLSDYLKLPEKIFLLKYGKMLNLHDR